MSRRSRRRLVAALLVAADLTALLIAVLVSAPAWQMAVPLIASIVILYTRGSLYRCRPCLSVLDDLPSLLGRAALGGMLVTTLDLVVDGDEGRETLAAVALFGLVVVPMRLIVYTAVRRSRRRGRASTATLVIGDDDVAGQLDRTLRGRPEYGLRSVGYLSPVTSADVSSPARRHGDLSDLPRVVTESGISTLVIAAGSLPEAAMRSLPSECESLGCEVFVLPRLFELGALGRDADLVWGLPLVRITPRHRRGRPTRNGVGNIGPLLGPTSDRRSGPSRYWTSRYRVTRRSALGPFTEQ